MHEFQVSVSQDGSERVYMAVAAMHSLQIVTGDSVLVRNSSQIDHFTTGIAWPDLSTPANVALLSTAARLTGQFAVGDNVQILKYNGAEIPALQVSVRAATPDKHISQFLLNLKEALIGKLVIPNQVVDLVCFGKRWRFILNEIGGSQTLVDDCVYRVTRETRFVVDQQTKTEPSQPTQAQDSYSSTIGGLAQQVHTVREIVEVALNSPELFLQYGLRPPRGVLLFGPPGTGKTLIARTVAQETGAHVVVINGAEVVSKFYGETEQKIRDIFAVAAERAPTVIFIDEIDALCPKRDEAPSEVEKRVVATLLTLMDGASSAPTNADRIIVIGATNRPNSIDDALRRPGRFDREVEIGIPNSDSRLDILNTIMKRIPNSLSPSDMQFIASRSHGYVGADLAAVCREAGLKCIKRCAHHEMDLRVNMSDMQEAVTEIRPSAMREIMLEVPKVRWSDVGGQSDIKQRLKESVEWPLQNPEAFQRLGIRPPKGILLYGPPGCSKTLMAKALATEAGSNFIAVKGPELFSKWVGESEKAVREVFRKARAASPSIVFFDEIDALTVKRGSSGDGGSSVADRVLSQLLNELDGIEPLVNVTVVAATNRPDIIDDALLRPGRIDRILYVGPPDLPSRREIFRIQMEKMTCDVDVNLEELAVLSDGCSGAEAVAIGQEAALFAMEEDVHIDSIKRRHFLKALTSFTRRITPEMLQFYADFQAQSGLQSI